MKPIQLMLFDVTGTLLRPSPPAPMQYARAAVKYLGFPAKELSSANHRLDRSFASNFKIQREKYPCYGARHGMSSHTWWFAVFSNCMSDCFHHHQLPIYSDQQLNDAFKDVYTNFKWDSVPHAQKVLGSLKQIPAKNNMFVKLAAVSNSDNRTSVALSQNGLLHFFETVVTSEEAKCEKPDPKIFDFALNKLFLDDFDRTQVIYIGNSYKQDFVAARNAGFQALLVTSEDQPLSNNEHKVSDLVQLLDLVRKAND